MVHQVAEAVLVHGVATGHDCDGEYAVEEEFAAHWAVAVDTVLPTRVAVQHASAVAAATGVAVEEIGFATRATDAALVAMPLLLPDVVVEEAALETSVASKHGAACHALGSERLDGVAQRALHTVHSATVHVVHADQHFPT